MSDAALQRALRRDRRLLAAALFGVAALAWAHLAIGSQGGGHGWGLRQLGTAFLMWFAMMLAMMLPIVSPWVLAFAETARRRTPNPGVVSDATSFLLGYLAVWTAYSAAAALAQAGLQRAALLAPGQVLESPLLAAAALTVAALYQWSPLRTSCLRHCRSPFGFFLSSWREGPGGAFAMGLRHGLFCAGCCWALMALGFVFGVMNLLWMAGLTLFVLLEKVAPFGAALARPSGAVLLGCAVWVLVR